MDSSKRSLDDRLNRLKPEAPSLNPTNEDVPVRNTYIFRVDATEKQVDILKAHLRTMKIRFQVTS